MSAKHIAFHERPARIRGIGETLGSAIARGIDRMLLWQDRARMRRGLASMDDRLLKDIGLTRDEVRFELRKPFWRP